MKSCVVSWSLEPLEVPAGLATLLLELALLAHLVGLDESAELAGVLALAAIPRVPPVTTRGQNYPGLCDTTRLT